ncbi:MAG: PspC domain-containing protein [Calditrichaeota bacterium]|nr:PspC domain-containing protein [Calditrichota bacterium]
MNEQTPPVKRLFRSNENRVIAGICGGLGEYFSIDPVAVRLAWIVLILFGGSGILLYILAWLLMPRRP